MPTRRTTMQAAAAALAGAATLGTTATASAAPPGGRGGRRGGAVRVMTFNIRLALTTTRPGQPDHWGDREPLVTRLLRDERPALLGVQEATYPQLAAVERGLPGHRMLGYGRSGGSDGEFSAVFHDAERFEALAWDQYWLSDTPDLIGSATWGNNVTRIVTWARLAERRTGRELVHVNTHFDHQSENARVRSAEAVRAQVAALDVPAVVTGDFNAPAGASAPYDVLTGDGGLVDTWSSARRRLSPAWGTFPNYGKPVDGGNRIDWVLATPDVRVETAEILTTRYRGRWPSDHTPVQADVLLP